MIHQIAFVYNHFKIGSFEAFAHLGSPSKSARSTAAGDLGGSDFRPFVPGKASRSIGRYDQVVSDSAADGQQGRARNIYWKFLTVFVHSMNLSAL